MDLIRFIFACFGIFANTIICIIRFIFASKYSHKFACKYSFSHTGEYLPQNIRFEKNIRKTLSEFSQSSEFLLAKYSHTSEYSVAKYSHTSEYSLASIHILANIRELQYIGEGFTNLRPQLIFIFLKIFA
jgi:hypothetical protein